jgi:hypothetical protein
VPTTGALISISLICLLSGLKRPAPLWALATVPRWVLRCSCRQRFGGSLRSGKRLWKLGVLPMGQVTQLRHLRCFIAVAEEGMPRRGGAAASHKAQPSLRRQIRVLEMTAKPTLTVGFLTGQEMDCLWGQCASLVMSCRTSRSPYPAQVC